MHSTAPKTDRCRVCGNPSLIPCISIGSQYLSSVFPEHLDYRGVVPQWPLDLVMCENKEDNTTCGLVQLGHRLDLSAMYDAYPYTSSSNTSMASILKDVADSGRALRNLRPDDLILDIGGNDGTLLSFFQKDDVDLFCIDAAKNVVPVLKTDRYIHICDFFSADVFASTAKKKARLIFSIAMFYHLSDPVTFSRDVAACLDDGGVWIIQMAYLPAMLRTNMYDNIVHEHNGYYAAHHMAWIMEQVGLEIFDVTLNEVYGGSFRVFVKKKGNANFPQTERYQGILREELKLGIFDPATYRSFMQRIEKTREDLRSLCREIKDQGRTIWVYGASTKGNTILQYCGLGKDDIVAAADANPFKLGKYIIGADILIKDEVTMRTARPDYLLALPYSFVDAFMKREVALVARGTKFIVPLPEVCIVP